MKALRVGYVTGALLGALWAVVAFITVAVVMSFATGESVRPSGSGAVLVGAIAGLVAVRWQNRWLTDGAALAAALALAAVGVGALRFGEDTAMGLRAAALIFGAGATGGRGARPGIGNSRSQQVARGGRCVDGMQSRGFPLAARLEIPVARQAVVVHSGVRRGALDQLGRHVVRRPDERGPPIDGMLLPR